MISARRAASGAACGRICLHGQNYAIATLKRRRQDEGSTIVPSRARSTASRTDKRGANICRAFASRDTFFAL